MRNLTQSWHVWLLSPLLVFALVAAACGSGSNTADGPTDTEATTTDGAEQPTTAPETNSSDGEPEPDETADDGSAELTATDTGVTESLIRIGASFPDITMLGREPGDVEAKFQTVVDAINETGGINGRTIELFYRTANPLNDVDYEAQCVEFAEDIEVFAVVGLFPRTTADCYGDLYDTTVISAFAITAEQMSGYSTPGITIEAHPERLLTTRIATLIDAGVITADSKVALHGSEQASDSHDAYLTALEAAGINVVVDTLAIQNGEDLIALQSEMSATAEVWRSSGADVVMASTALSSQTILIGYDQSGLDLPIVLPEDTGVAPSLMQDQLGLDLSPFENATALVGGLDQASKYLGGVDGVTECVDAFQAASGEEVALDEADGNNLGPTIVACQVFDIFTAIAQAAGTELTTESFAAAAAAFGEIQVTDLAEASLGPDKFDLNDSVGVVAQFNPETNQFEPV